MEKYGTDERYVNATLTKIQAFAAELGQSYLNGNIAHALTGFSKELNCEIFRELLLFDLFLTYIGDKERQTFREILKRRIE